MRNRSFFTLLAPLLLGAAFISCAQAPEPAAPEAASHEPLASVPSKLATSAGPRNDQARHEYSTIARELDAELKERVLPFWFPKIVDRERGGFAQVVKHDGTLADDGKRFLIFQSRMTWVAAEVALRYPELKAEYLAYVEHGLDFLEHKLWDEAAGGLYWELDRDGKPPTVEKHGYGIAFGIYAAATAAQATGSARARQLASRIFDWFDAHAHDAKHGGYYEPLTREGHPLLTAPAGRDNDGIGTVYGRKSMNSHIHILEALTALQNAAPSSTVGARLKEIFLIVRDRIMNQQGFFDLYFEPNWTPIAGKESYGHDVEGAFLLLEAAAALGMPNDPTTEAKARLLIDRALERGWDAIHGGFFNEGEPDSGASDRRKVWWVQAEGLNGLLSLDELHGSQTTRYFDAFRSQWQFIKSRVSDRAHGEWWGYLGPAGELAEPEQEKGNQWKACYHNARALMVSAAMLKKLAIE